MTQGMGSNKCFYMEYKRLNMIEKTRQWLSSIFDEPEQNKTQSLRLILIFSWFMLAGIIGGIVPFILVTEHGLLVSYLTAAVFIVFTAKPVLKKSIKNDN